MTKYQVVFFLFVTLIGCTPKNSTEQNPNIIVFFVDDLGYNDLGFRNTDYYTPNIDALKKESLTCELPCAKSTGRLRHQTTLVVRCLFLFLDFLYDSL